ncbi:MAG TPA: ATP-binding protein [Anaerolineaceae bacterium]|nr:ATP-binding protein [Anaerolineaceae bacterium]
MARRSRKDPQPQQAGDAYQFSGDFRNAVINIKSTIVGAEEVRDIEQLPPEPGDSPYLGLQSFTEKDAGHFFGRELLTAKIIARLGTTRLLCVIGASGSGKSSLVRAGVIPALKSGAALADGLLPPANSRGWSYRVINPSAHPLQALAAALGSPAADLSQLIQNLQANPTSLTAVARGLLAKETSPQLLLVVDQFEEVFTQCRDETERRTFIDCLLAAANPQDVQPVQVILVLRADFYASLAQYDRLREVVSAQQEFIGAMSRDELFRAIVQPAALGQWKIQEGLVELMLDDTGDEPGALPLLSHALLETWNHRHGRTMTLSSYRDSGGVRGAIAKTAEMVFRQRLTPQQQAIARLIFIRLVDLEDNAPDTRRRAAFSELITRASDPVTIDAVLSILIDARLVTTDVQEPGDVKVIEVAHEALIREWPTLREWLSENRSGLILHRQLTDATSDWLRLDRDPGALYRGTRLKQALEWADQNSADVSLDEQAFLEASKQNESEEAERDRQLRMTRNLRRWIAPGLAIAILGILAILAYLTGAYAVLLPPAKMNGVYNIAVAEFGSIGADGKVTAAPSGAGVTTSGWVADQLKGQLKSNSNLLVWHDGSDLRRLNVTIGRVEGMSPAEKIAAAKAMAARLQAQMVVFGNFDTRQKPAQLILEVWIAPQAEYDFADVQGSYQVAAPVEIADPAHPGIEVQPGINAQASTLAWVALGLTQMRFGQSKEALDSFRRAESFSPDSAAVQFFIGRESLFLSDRDPANQEALTASAEQAFQKAVQIADYPNGYIGLGSVYFARAKRLVEAAGAQTDSQMAQTQIGQAARFSQSARENYARVLTMPAAARPPGIPVDLYAHLGIGTTLRLEGEILYRSGKPMESRQALDEAAKELKTIVKPLEAENQERFLAQAYQVLGTVYQWLGFLDETASLTQASEEAYTQAAQYYDSCTNLGKTSLDRIVKEDIAGKLCGPYRKDVQKRLDILSGGS